jgi:hypothetical protein
MANVVQPTDVVMDIHDRMNSHLVLVGLVYTGPVSYVTGGDPIAGADVGCGTIDYIDFAGGGAYNGSNSVYLPTYIPATGKVIWYVPSTNAEVAPGTNLSTYTARVFIVCH